jgi:hypothetical protein
MTVLLVALWPARLILNLFRPSPGTSPDDQLRKNVPECRFGGELSGFVLAGPSVQSEFFGNR